MALQFTDATFDEVLSSNTVVVADFWAEWCGPCKMVGPFIEQLAAEYEGKAAIGKIDSLVDVGRADQRRETGGYAAVHTYSILHRHAVANRTVAHRHQSHYIKATRIKCV